MSQLEPSCLLATLHTPDTPPTPTPWIPVFVQLFVWGKRNRSLGRWGVGVVSCIYPIDDFGDRVIGVLVMFWTNVLVDCLEIM